MSEKRFLEVRLSIEEDQLERLKSSLPNRDQKKSGTQAILEAITIAIASQGQVVLDETMRKELASRAGMGLPKDSKAVLRCFEVATQLTPDTVHVRIDPGIASEIKGHADGRGLSFQEMAKEILEQSVVDRYLYSLSFRNMVFTDHDWKLLLAELGEKGKGPSTGKELLVAIRTLVSKAVAETKASHTDIPMSNSEAKV